MQTESAPTHAFMTQDELRDRGFRMVDPPLALMGYDPSGDGADRDAVTIVSREEWRRGELYDPDLAVEFVYRILYASYLPTDWEFSDRAAKLLALHKAMIQWRNSGKMAGHFIFIETNGVGHSMASFLREKMPQYIRPYSTVATLTDEMFVKQRLSMPRLAALDHLRMQFDLHRIKAVRDAPGVEDLFNEMNSFVWTRPKRAEAMPGQRDDLIMSLTGPVWFGSKVVPPLTKQMKVEPSGVSVATSERVRLN